MRFISIVLIALLALVRCTFAASAIDMDRMGEADRIINEAIEHKNIPGGVLLVERGEKNIYFKAYGNRAVQPEVVGLDDRSCQPSIHAALLPLMEVEGFAEGLYQMNERMLQ